MRTFSLPIDLALGQRPQNLLFEGQPTIDVVRRPSGYGQPEKEYPKTYEHIVIELGLVSKIKGSMEA